MSTLFLFIWTMVSFLWPLFLLAGVYVWIDHRGFMRSTYREATGNGYFRTRTNAGLYGEYLTYLVLERVPGYKKLLANVYLPKGDEGTTEVDVIMLHEAGIFVFESKNYSGWIYGDENSKMWTQTLNKRTKYKVFNPIWQNKGHVTAIKKALATTGIDDSLFRSYIVFSQRCKLQNVTYTSLDVWVLKRGQLKNQIKRDVSSSMGALTPEQVDKAYELLVGYAKADETTKEAHVLGIKRKQVRRYAEESTAKVAVTAPTIDVSAAVTKATPTSDQVCPACGSELKVHQGRRGTYYACEACGQKQG